jgi:site-specific DNA-cytosine methylase
MNILSLFDGMSCGRIAADRAGIKVGTYYASELDKYAITVTQANWPDTVQLGDVTKWREWDIEWSSIDLLIGGSPCQGFSFAGKQLAFYDPRSALFFVYVDILNHIHSLNLSVKFMLENVKIKKEFLNIISDYLGVNPVLINSNLVSAQNRNRYYWVNFGDIKQPDDKGVLLKDVISGPVSDFPKGRYPLIKQTARGYNKGGIKAKDGKTPTLTSSSWVYNNHLLTSTSDFRILTVIECERLQTVPDNYTNHVSNTQRYKMLGNGWTVAVIAHIFKQL